MGTPLDWGFKGYNNYGNYLKEKFQGRRIFKVIVDAGFTCPNRDGSKGYGGCTYCNVDSFTPELARKLPTIEEQVSQGIKRARESYKADKVILYFQPNTNTYATIDVLKSYYDRALVEGGEDVVGLSVGTRPDCLDEEKISLLASYADRYAVDVEMGMESIYDDTLLRINRGCSHAEMQQALCLLEGKPIDVCVHTVFGFPWETKEMMRAYVNEINKYTGIKFVKFHHLHIVEGSIMGVHYKKKPFELFTMQGYAEFLCELLPLLRPDIVVQRLFGISDWDKLIAPNWGLKKSEIQTFIDKFIEQKNVVQGSLYKELASNV